MRDSAGMFRQVLIRPNSAMSWDIVFLTKSLIFNILRQFWNKNTGEIYNLMKMVRILIIIIGLTVALAGNLAAQARLSIVNDRFDIGGVPSDVTVYHNFWFKSTGVDTVVIDSIITNCGCVMAPLENNHIAPGDSLRVNFCWYTGRRFGPFGSYPYIYSNDDTNRPARVYITGGIFKFPDSLRPVSFKPHIFDLSRFSDIAKDSIVFKLQNHTDKNVSVKLLACSLDECELSIPDSVTAGSVAYGYIKVKQEYLDKEFNGSCTLEVGKESTMRVTLPIRRKFYR